jgi:GxxExxY protein
MSVIVCVSLRLKKKRTIMRDSSDQHEMSLNDITYKINGAIFEVNRVLGPGFIEKVYENALIIELRELGLRAENQVPVNVDYKGQNVGEYVADVLVENKIIVELKAVEKLTKLHEAQLLNYLKATDIKVGLLVNFHDRKANIKRMVLNMPEGH